MAKEVMFTDARTRPLHGLLLEVFVEFCDNNIVAGHKIPRIVVTMVVVDKAVDVEAFLAFHAMHYTGLVGVVKATEKAHEPQCLP